MTELKNPSNKIVDKRWHNAKFIAEKIKRFCRLNNYGFILGDDGDNPIYTAEHLITTDDEIFLCMPSNSKTVLYINDVDRDQGAHDTTAEWYKQSGLSDLQFVKLIPDGDFKLLLKVADDEVLYD